MFGSSSEEIQACNTVHWVLLECVRLSSVLNYLYYLQCHIKLLEFFSLQCSFFASCRSSSVYALTNRNWLFIDTDLYLIWLFTEQWSEFQVVSVNQLITYSLPLLLLCQISCSAEFGVSCKDIQGYCSFVNQSLLVQQTALCGDKSDGLVLKFLHFGSWGSAFLESVSGSGVLRRAAHRDHLVSTL